MGTVLLFLSFFYPVGVQDFCFSPLLDGDGVAFNGTGPSVWMSTSVSVPFSMGTVLL